MYKRQLFSQINTLLGIRHITAAARTARSNGQTEAMVRRLCEHLKFYSKDDYSVEEVIPLIEMNLRAAPPSKLGISSYELVFGRSMPLGIPGNPETSSEENTDRVAYYKWLATELHRLHGALKKAKEDLKLTKNKLMIELIRCNSRNGK